MSYPSTLDTFPTLSATDDMDTSGKEHDVVHNNVHTAIAALETKLGIDSSAVTGSLDYKVAALRARGLLYSTTSNSTIANTATETAFAGSYSVPANTLAVSDVILVDLAGTVGTTILAPTLRAKLKYGTVVLLDTGAITLVANLSANPWSVRCRLTVRSIGGSGSVECAAEVFISTSATVALMILVSGGTVTIDTTAGSALTATVQWGTADAANTVTDRQFTIVKP